jgi:mutator protein MutT
MSTNRTDRPVPVGIGLIARGGSYLIRQRPAGTALAGSWEFPGGKCEPAESPAAATLRECREELGLAVVLGRLRRVVLHRYPHAWVELYYYDCATEEPLAEPEPGTGFRWVPAVELPSLSFPEANEPILRELAEGLEPAQGCGAPRAAPRDRHEEAP